MMQSLYYDRDGRPVSRRRWQQLGRQPGYSRVGYAAAIRHGRQVTVITFWSGIAGDGPDGPLIFCTCAGIRGPGGRRAAYQRLWGWPDLAGAHAGHQAVTAWITELADFLAGHTNQLPAPDPALPGTPPADEVPQTPPGGVPGGVWGRAVVAMVSLSQCPPAMAARAGRRRQAGQARLGCR